MTMPGTGFPHGKRQVGAAECTVGEQLGQGRPDRVAGLGGDLSCWADGRPERVAGLVGDPNGAPGPGLWREA